MNRIMINAPAPAEPKRKSPKRKTSKPRQPIEPTKPKPTIHPETPVKEPDPDEGGNPTPPNPVCPFRDELSELFFRKKA